MWGPTGRVLYAPVGTNPLKLYKTTSSDEEVVFLVFAQEEQSIQIILGGTRTLRILSKCAGTR